MVVAASASAQAVTENTTVVVGEPSGTTADEGTVQIGGNSLTFCNETVTVTVVDAGVTESQNKDTPLATLLKHVL